MNDDEISKMMDWSAGKERNTKKHGPKTLYTAKPNDDFWELYKTKKVELRDSGVIVKKDKGKVWQVQWWKNSIAGISKEIENEKKN